MFDKIYGQVHKFEMDSNQWVQYDCESMRRLNVRGSTIVSVQNDNFIVIIHRGEKSIFVYDIANNIFRLSTIRSSFDNYNCQAVVMRDYSRANLMAFGFVNQCFKSPQYKYIYTIRNYQVILYNLLLNGFMMKVFMRLTILKEHIGKLVWMKSPCKVLGISASTNTYIVNVYSMCHLK